MRLLFLTALFSISVAVVLADEVNPEDVDDVRPPVLDEKEQKTLLTSTQNVTVVAPAVPEVPEVPEVPAVPAVSSTPASNATVVNVPKTEQEKKDELLTGKEEAPAKTEVQATTLGVETLAPIVPKVPEVKEEEKENAAPEFEAKQEVEGGKGEEDPDANVDKPAAVDPPKDEADGAAKEDRETPAVGAEGLHEAVEEARGNPAPGVPVVEAKKDSADEEQTLDAVPVARPHRFDSSKEYQSGFQRIQGSADDSTGFMSFFFVASFLIIAIYLLQHNKKKILGLIFEGRKGGPRRNGGNVRYRRLSQNEMGN